MTKISTLSILLLGLLLLTGWTFELVEKPGSEYVVEARQATLDNEYKQAEKLYYEAIERAYDDGLRNKARNAIAALHLRDLITPPDYSKALALLQQSYAAESEHAALWLALAYREGKGVEKDLSKAFAYYMEGQDRFPQSNIAMAELHRSPERRADYIAKADKLLSSDLNPPTEAMLDISRHYREGVLIPKNTIRGEFWLIRAASTDSQAAKIELADWWEEQGHEPYQDVIALKEQVAQQGSERAILDLAFLYALGDKVPQDQNKARAYMERAVSLNPANAYRIGRWYEEMGAENPAYAEVAYQWMVVAAKSNHPDALMRMARMYWQGERVEQNLDKARALYQQAMAAGSDKAMFELQEREARLAMRLRKQKEKEEARQQKKLLRAQKRKALNNADYHYWLPLAQKGDGNAMRETGLSLIRGHGVKQNIAQGKEWLEKAASTGDGEAMYELAQFYTSGVGAKIDVKQAHAWYTKSAKAGYAPGQYQLGLSFARGLGVTADKTKAKDWFMEAKQNGYPLSDELITSLLGM